MAGAMRRTRTLESAGPAGRESARIVTSQAKSAKNWSNGGAPRARCCNPYDTATRHLFPENPIGKGRAAGDATLKVMREVARRDGAPTALLSYTERMARTGPSLPDPRRRQ